MQYFQEKIKKDLFEFYDPNANEKKISYSFDQLSNFIYDAYKFMEPMVLEIYG